MTVEEFKTLLLNYNSYETGPENKRSLAGRILGWSDWWFYMRLFSIIFNGYLSACRGRFDYKTWMNRAVAILELMENCGGKLNISGIERLRKIQGPAVYVSNHMSMLETMLLPGAIILPLHRVAVIVKQSLLTYPFFGKIMRHVEHISVGRENAREDLRHVLTMGEENLRNGLSVLIFPQATRNAVFCPREFNSLGVKLAERADVPVVPVALKTDFQGVGKIIRDFGPIDRTKTAYFKFGEPMLVRKNNKEIHEKIVRFIIENLQKWGGKVSE